MWERGQLSISAHIDTIVQTKLTRASGLRSIKIIGQRVPELLTTFTQSGRTNETPSPRRRRQAGRTGACLETKRRKRRAASTIRGRSRVPTDETSYRGKAAALALCDWATAAPAGWVWGESEEGRESEPARALRVSEREREAKPQRFWHLHGDFNFSTASTAHTRILWLCISCICAPIINIWSTHRHKWPKTSFGI